MISKQITWRECTEEEQVEVHAFTAFKSKRKRKSGWKYPSFLGTKMFTGVNKSRPGARIRAKDENETFTYTSA